MQEARGEAPRYGVSRSSITGILVALLVLSCNWLNRSATPLNQLRLVINEDTVFSIRGDTLSLSITAENISDNGLAVLPGGSGLSLWQERTEFVSDSRVLFSGVPEYGLSDTVHLEPGEAITFDARFMACGEPQYTDTVLCFLQYAVILLHDSVKENIRSWSRNSVVIVTRSRSE